MGYAGAFVPVVCTSPCPGFNRGKIAPGGGRGSRSPLLRCFVSHKVQSGRRFGDHGMVKLSV